MTVAALMCSLFFCAQDTEYPYKAAAGAVKITPEPNVPLSGFNVGRIATDVHDDLYARCLIFQDKNGNKVVFVSLDLLAILRYDVLQIKDDFIDKKIADPAMIFIAATHQHHGPDTIGIWGTRLFKAGRNEKYLAKMRGKITQLIKDTNAKLESAKLSVVRTRPKTPVSQNSRFKNGNVLDDEIVLMTVKGKGGVIATLFNFACHPESLKRKNTKITADFPGYVVNKLEKKYGGVGIFVNGALGAMVSPLKGSSQPKGFGYADEMAEVLVKSADEVIKKSEDVDAVFQVKTKSVSLPLENNRFKGAMEGNGVMPQIIPTAERTYKDGNVRSEVSLITLGPLSIMCVPGELPPQWSLAIKKKMDAKYIMMFGLTNDEVGYILRETDFNREDNLYSYEKTMSLGPKSGEEIWKAMEELVTPED